MGFTSLPFSSAYFINHSQNLLETVELKIFLHFKRKKKHIKITDFVKYHNFFLKSILRVCK